VTNATKNQTNRKPADRLFELREQIRVLKAEEEELREGFIAGDLPLEGDEHVVSVEVKINERIDARAMRQNVDESIWAPYLISTPSSYIKTERKHVTQKSCVARNANYIIQRSSSAVTAPRPEDGASATAHPSKL
jgi:uncharacterized protein (UPF0548 family)